MICIFKNTANKKQLIETNGEYILDNICTYGMITEGLNDEFTLEIDFEILAPVKKELYDLITEEGILKVEDEYGDEFFVISEIYKTSDSIRAIARQITIAETLDLFLEDVRPENQNGAGALTHIFSNTTCTHEIVVNSDIQTISTAYYNRKTVYEALHDSDMAFQERWGGEVYRRQFNLHINNKVGSYRGVKIKSNKNLTGFEENTTKDTVCTRIYPKGFNGITIEEKYIDSENIGMYKRPISRVYTFEDVKVRDENTGEDEEVFETLEEAQEELKERAKALFEEDKVDLIKAYYTINHVDLRTTEEYKNYSATEMTCIGDEVDVEEETLGIDIRTRVVKRKYNILTKEREETELSNVGLKRVITLPDLEKEIEKIPSTESFLEAAKEIATGLINAGIKNSHVVVRENEILIMDTKDINTATNVWRWNSGGLGHSSTGYYGTYGTAITQDGSIVADFITTGQLNAALIKTGILISSNEKTWINMDDGTFSFADGNLSWLDNVLNINGNLKQINSKTNKTACEIKDNSFIVYDHSKDDSDSHEVGRLRAYRTQNKSDSKVRNAIALNSRYDDLLIIGYLNEVGQLHEVMVFDSTGEYDGVSNVSINGAVKAYKLYFQNSENTFAGDIIGDGNMLRFRTSLNEGGLFVFGQAGSLTDNIMEVSRDRLYHKGSVRCGEDVSCKNLLATGTKNRLVKTKDYGNRALNAYETASCFFGDIGESQTDSNGEVIINIDDIFLQTVNTNEEYHVFISKYGKGDIWVEEKNENMFKVKSTLPNIKFSYEIKAKQKNYESERLKEIQLSEEAY